jgi:2-polyprenyl-3-methyl-5-hydroxy-6-metoxy-1,4-benzoquinol methylase
VRRLAAGVRLSCPVCGKAHPENCAEIVTRTPERTYRRCGNCGIIYIAWTCSVEKTDYNKDYFFADYKNQYGKTYLEDFDSIKAQGKRRCAIINSVHKRQDSGKPALLDVGCAYGPFLSAASDAGWNVFGLDVSKSAVDYVRETLHFQAKCGDFAGFDKKNAFDVTKVTIGRADKWLVDNAKQVALDIADYTHEITADFVKHIIKRHTNEGSERERGNVAITDEDIKNIPKIIYNSDYVIFGTKRYGEERIIYVKKVEKGTALYFEEILLGKKNKSLRGVTLFKRKEDLSENKLYAILKSNTKNDVSNAKIVVGDGGQSIVEANNIVDPTAATSARPIDNSINNIARLLDSVNSFTEKKAVKRQQKFDAITMWYVIEHFQQLGAALDTVSAMLKEGGIFAFSTPSAAGVSGTRNTDAFFAASPRDHYTVWEPAVARSLLQERGFKIARVVSTGHHPERFPLYKKISRFPLLVPKDSVALKPCKTLLSVYSRLFHLGDTFEIYCIKTGGIYE